MYIKKNNIDSKTQVIIKKIIPKNHVKIKNIKIQKQKKYHHQYQKNNNYSNNNNLLE